MTTYSVPELSEKGAPIVLAIIIQQIRGGEEPFLTYGTLARTLEKQLGIRIIFSVHIGHVAGQMIDDILKVQADAPLINGLIADKNGIPGDGFAGYHDKHIRKKGQKTWLKLARSEQLDVIAKIRTSVRQFPDWDSLYQRVYGSTLEKNSIHKAYTEKDGLRSGRGAGESDEHKALKEWAKENPNKLGISTGLIGETEVDLPSGDRIDVLFSGETEFVVVEVKSCRSSPPDLERGIYQCIKYRATIEAREYPIVVKVRTILLTERKLTANLAQRARALKVITKVHHLNVNCTSCPAPPHRR